MDVDAAKLAAEVLPYVTAVAQAYGARTMEKLREAVVDGASDATVGLGRRVLDRILLREESRPMIEGALADVAVTPDDDDSAAALRLQIRKALAADPELATEIAAMLPSVATHNEASGERSIAAGTNSGINNTGDNATFNR